MKTGNKPGEPRCTLGRLIPIHYDAEAIKREGWLNERILVVGEADDRLTWIERQIIAGIGKRLYERRGG